MHKSVLTMWVLEIDIRFFIVCVAPVVQFNGPC